ncbi:uncharacterized protein LOC115969236 [Quercus lobata]|uniref:uncharacterized protein LOC115969236 n=1 Tax=Quercus lobata TaxID=97700 RepID=UPI00124838D2|nr:uncharacterized protein LOC115969236 [Quercus lobata]
MFNEIEGEHDDVAISTFKAGLLAEHDLRKSLTGISDEDKVGTIQPHDDALVVTLTIGGYDVKRVMIDQGSAVDIMYPDLYKGLGLKPEDLAAYSSSLVSFEGRIVVPKGHIRLLVQTGRDVMEVDFIVVDVFSPYTAIMGRPWLHTLGAVSSTLHQKVKYPSRALPLDVPADEVKCEDLERVIVANDPERFFQVGAKLPLQEKERLLEFLRENVDMFTWSPYEAPGVDSNFICHRLNVNPSVIPKRQPPQRPSKEHVETVKSEVAKLKQAGAIKEDFYP